MEQYPLNHAVARIVDTNRTPQGAGVLVSDTHLLTCAHVVNTALGQAQNTPEPPLAAAGSHPPGAEEFAYCIVLVPFA